MGCTVGASTRRSRTTSTAICSWSPSSASARLRYARLADRSERPLTAEEAQRRDYQEIENLEKGGPIALADFTLLNNDAPDALLASLDALIARLDFAP